MCTSGKDQSAILGTKTALCVLSEILGPLKVQDISQEDKEQLRVQLCSADRSFLEEKYSSIRQCPYYDIVVPQKCLIPPVSFIDINRDNFGQPKQQIFDEFYYPCALANVNSTDVVAWAVTSVLNGSQLIPCILYGSGFDTLTASKGYAYVCPLNYSSETFINQGYTSVPGWGKVYKVEVFSKVYMKYDENTIFGLHPTEAIVPSNDIPWRKKTYTFEYKPYSTEVEQNSAEALKSGAYPGREIGMDKAHKFAKSSVEEASGGNKGKHLTRERIMQSEYIAQSKKEGVTERPYNKCNEIPQGQPLNRKNYDACREDDSSQMPGERVARAVNYFSTNEYPELHKTSMSPASASRDTKRKTRQTNGNDSSEIVLFGRCFASEKTEEVTIKEVECGDIVVATSMYREPRLGEVLLICKISSINPEQIFVGVEFEEKINILPFEVRHVWEDAYRCDRHCGNGNIALIPLDILVKRRDYAASRLYLLKSSANEDEANNDKKVPADFALEATRREFLQLEPLNLNSLLVSPEKLKCIGIQGNDNSCYMDAVLFALYGFTSNFDEGLHKQKSCYEPKDDLKMKQEAARNVLRYDIVTPLRSASKVNWTSVYKLRFIMADIMDDKSYLADFKDAEQFISNLFGNVLQVPEFFEIGEDTKDYVLQLFPAISPEGQQVKAPSVQYLLQEYCDLQEIKLRTVPQRGFLIKLPVCDGFSHYEVVYPNLELNLDKLLDKRDGANNVMILRSVVCLEKNHFTCFVRSFSNAQNAETMATWFFHDSMAAKLGDSILTECEGLEESLRLGLPTHILDNPSRTRHSSNLGIRGRKWIDRLLSTAYICVYEPPYRST